MAVIVVDLVVATTLLPFIDHVPTPGQMRLASWMMVVVVVSDDPTFLAAFAQEAREGRLLVWATRLIIVTRRSPHHLHPVYKTLAFTNSLLLLVDDTPEAKRCVGVSVFKPFCVYRSV